MYLYYNSFILQFFLFCLGATISAPPTTNTPGGSGDGSKVATIATTGAASKIIHPAEDISLEEIRARHPKYAKSIPVKREESPCSSSNAASEVKIIIISIFI